MSGSGARDSGSPPWGPAEPAPGPADTQAMPGFGAAASSADAPTRSGRGTGPGRGAAGEKRAGGKAGGGNAAPDTAADAPEDQDPPAGGTGARRRHSFWRELAVLLVIALVLALLIKTFLVQAFYIPSGSMENTLEVGDRVLINKVVYDLRSIHRGDIIVFDGTGSWDFNTPPSGSNIFSKAVDELEGLVGV